MKKPLVPVVLLTMVLTWNASFAAAQEQRDDPESSHKVSKPTEAVVVMTPTKGHKAHGVIRLRQREGHLEITGEVRGLTPGKHGFHIHEFGDLRAADGSSAGAHFAIKGHKHAGPDDPERHEGDLGNIEANEEGVAVVQVKARGLDLHFVIGRSLVVHADADDLKSQPSGDSGDRVAVGVIGFANIKPTEE